MNFNFSFQRAISDKEKFFLFSLITFCLKNNTNMVSMEAKDLLHLFPNDKPDQILLKIVSACIIKFENIPVDKYKILGQKYISGQFFSFYFIDYKMTIFFILNPSIFSLLKAIDQDILCSKFFIPKSIYAQYFFTKLLQNIQLNELKISAAYIKSQFSFSESSWKSFLHRLPATENRLKMCEYISNCKIDICHKNTAGSPVDSICIKYAFKEHSDLSSLFTYYYPVVGYSDVCRAYLFDKFCNQCGGILILKKDASGKLFICCTNSIFWHLGRSSCNEHFYL